MKRIIPLLAISVRQTFYRFMAIAVLMSFTQAILFKRALERLSADFHTYPDMFAPLETVVSESRMHLVFIAALILLCLVLAYSACDSGSKSIYTLKRLAVSQERICCLWTVYYFFCISALILWQLGLIIIFSKVYTASGPGLYSYSDAHTLFLAFWRNNFLHSIMPLEDISRHLRNISLIASLSMGITAFSFRQRTGKRSYSGILCLAFTAIIFVFPHSNLPADVTFSLLALSVTGVSLWSILGGDNND